MISQREARRLRKRVQALEDLERERCNAWARDYPGGVHIDTIAVTDTAWAVVHTARLLGHACVVIDDDNDRLIVMALPTGD